MRRDERVRGGKNGLGRCRTHALFVTFSVFAVSTLFTFMNTHLFLDANSKPIPSTDGGNNVWNRSRGVGDHLTVAPSSPPVSTHVSEAVVPYDVGYLLSLVQTPTTVDVGLGTPLDVGAAYYQPSTTETKRFQQPKPQLAEESRSRMNVHRRCNTGGNPRFKHRVMMYRSLPHPVCLAALLLHHHRDVSESLKAFDNRGRNKGRVLSHDLETVGNGTARERPFLTFLNTTDAVHRITNLFRNHGVEGRRDFSSFTNDALVHCRKVFGVKPGSSRHPRDAVFFDVADVFYAGGRFVLFVEGKKGGSEEESGGSLPLNWVPPQILSKLPLRQEVLTDSEATLALEQSVLPAARAAVRVARVKRLVKVQLRFGTMFPFVKGSWPQHRQDTLQLFIALVHKREGSDTDERDSCTRHTDVAKYAVGYFQPPTDFQVAHHTLIETILTSFISQQHFLRTRIGEKLRGKRNGRDGHAIVITSRPYYKTNGKFRKEGCRRSFERCLKNGPWGGIYVGQLEQFAGELWRRQKSCEISVKKKKSEDTQGRVSMSFSSLSSSSHSPVNILVTPHQQYWVYGLRKEETQFHYIKDESQFGHMLGKSRKSGQMIAVVDAPVRDRGSCPLNSSTQPVFHLQHFLIGYPTHCEPLFGSDPLFADIVDTLFYHIIPQGFNATHYEDFLEALRQLRQQEKPKEKHKKGSFRDVTGEFSIHMWKELLELFYVSYMDCQVHLRKFREMHFSRGLLEFMQEEGNVVELSEGNGLALDLRITGHEDPARGIKSLLHHFATRTAVSFNADDDDAYINKSHTIPLSDALYFLLASPPPLTPTKMVMGKHEGGAEAETAAQLGRVGERNAVSDVGDVFIFYSSRRHDWARYVVNEDVFLSRFPRDVEARLNGKSELNKENNSVPGLHNFRRVYLRVERFSANLSHGRQLFAQMEAHRTNIFIGAPGANLLNSLFLRPMSGVVTFSFGPAVDKVFYPTCVFPQHITVNINESFCAVQTRGLLWRSVALRQTCNRKVNFGKCRMRSVINNNNLLLDGPQYRRLVDAVVNLVGEQDKLRKLNCLM